MRTGQIPNNPYIIAKNVPHPGAFFVFGGVAAAIVVTAKIYVAEKYASPERRGGPAKLVERFFVKSFSLCDVSGHLSVKPTSCPLP